MDPIKIKFFDILKGARIRSSLPETCEEIDRHENRHDSKIRDFLYDEIAQYFILYILYIFYIISLCIF